MLDACTPGLSVCLFVCLFICYLWYVASSLVLVITEGNTLQGTFPKVGRGGGGGGGGGEFGVAIHC